MLKADIIGKDTYSFPFYGEKRPILIDLAMAISSETQPELRGYELIQRDADWFKAEIFVPQIYEGNGAFLSGTAAVLRDSSGNVTGAIESIRDVTDRKMAEENRIRLERQLLKTQKLESLSRMAGAISHHFNNMLAVVIGNLEIALDLLPRGTESTTYLADALTASGRAAEMSRLMLTYLGQTEAKREHLDLAEIVGDAQSLLRATIPANVQFNTETASQGPMIDADRAQVNQIIANLVANAAEALGEKEGCITLSAGTAARDTILKQKIFHEDWQARDGSMPVFRWPITVPVWIQGQ